MFKTLSVVAIMFIMVNLPAKAQQSNECSRTVQRCNHQIQGISDAISKQEEHSETKDQLLELLQEKKMRCAEYIQNACA